VQQMITRNATSCASIERQLQHIVFQDGGCRTTHYPHHIIAKG
jgi:hypothetical protein